MKILVVPILIFLVSTQAFSKWVLLLEYQWNKEYIAQNLCENKARPKLNCEGKCQLAKKVAAEENQSSQTPNLKLKFQEIVFSCDLSPVAILIAESDLLKNFPPYALKPCAVPLPSPFHPPA